MYNVYIYIMYTVALVDVDSFLYSTRFMNVIVSRRITKVRFYTQNTKPVLTAFSYSDWHKLNIE